MDIADSDEEENTSKVMFRDQPSIKLIKEEKEEKKRISNASKAKRASNTSGAAAGSGKRPSNLSVAPLSDDDSVETDEEVDFETTPEQEKQLRNVADATPSEIASSFQFA